tara:strand:+ start:909 stop:1436 length:528 start_codon:yes stop_codon:yes gene_type:complete
MAKKYIDANIILYPILYKSDDSKHYCSNWVNTPGACSEEVGRNQLELKNTPQLAAKRTMGFLLKLFLDIINKNFTGITSVLTWDEVVHTIWKKRGKEIAVSEGEKFFNLPNLILVDTNKNVVMNAQKLITKYGLKPRDAIHAATAILHECSEIISDDSDFDKVKELKRISPGKVL